MKPLLSLVALLGLSLPGTGWSDVRIDNRGRCFETSGLTAKLERSLRAHSASPDLDLQVSVFSSTNESGNSSVALTVRTPWGASLLERWYDLGPADCRSAGKLLSLVLERFLSTFPAERWKVLAKKARQMPPGSPRILEVAAQVAVSGELVPAGAAGELGVATEYGSIRHRFGLSVWGKTTTPRVLGQGQFMVIALLAGLRWRYTAYSWQPSVEIRVGPALIKGFGYDINYQRWVPWLDVMASVERRWRHIALGLQLTVTALRHQIFTEDGWNTEELPIIGLGIRVTIPITTRNL